MTEQELLSFAKKEIKVIKEHLFHEQTGAFYDKENFKISENFDRLEQIVNSDFEKLIDKVIELDNDLDEVVDMEIAMARAALLEEIDELREERVVS